jgi:UDP-N-acetylglucosamine 1-carboxyvinyltransferase
MKTAAYMSTSFVINGKKPLTGSIPVYGSKNAALPLIVASLLTSEPVTLRNISPILDVKTLREIINDIGVTSTHENDILTLTPAPELTPDKLSTEKMGALRRFSQMWTTRQNS